MTSFFFKDSLWAAEDIEAVFDQDPQRVCILQGPVAAKGSTIKDQPIKELLGGINDALVKRLLEHRYGGDVNAIPTIDYLSKEPTNIPNNLPGVNVSRANGSVVYEFGKTLPDTAAWLETLGGNELNWLRALVSSATIVQGTSYIDNPLRRVLAPRPYQKVVVSYDGPVPTSVVVYGAARSYGEHDSDFKSIEIAYNAATQTINLTLYEERRGVAVPLYLLFQYKPSLGFAPIHEVAEGRNKRIKEFYWKLWYGDDEVLPDIDIRENFVGPEVTINGGDVEQFCAVVGNQGESFKAVRTDFVNAPMDFSIVTGWQV